MNIAEFSVKRYQFTIVVFVMLMALGISSLLSIPKAEDPSFSSSNFSIVAIFPGATPTDIERLVVEPIERKLRALDDVKTIKTNIEDGVAVIQLERRSFT
jgi:multidrug efflux pump subunit AcrB